MTQAFTFTRLAAALALCSLGSAHALPVLSNTNLDGSLGLAGWQAVGDVATINPAHLMPAGIDWNPNTLALALGTATTWDQDDANVGAGSYSVSHSQDPAYDTDLGLVAQTLGVSPAALGTEAYEGSALSRQLSVTAGSTVSFQWRAWTRTPSEVIPSENDSLWFTATGAGQVATTAPIATLSSLFIQGTPVSNGVNHDWLDSGWRTVSFTAAQAGTLTLAWGVIDQGSVTDTTVMAVTGLNVVPGVPEPQAALMALVGLMAVAAWRRRT